jgi:hypothetical protein
VVERFKADPAEGPVGGTVLAGTALVSCGGLGDLFPLGPVGILGESISELLGAHGLFPDRGND